MKRMLVVLVILFGGACANFEVEAPANGGSEEATQCIPCVCACGEVCIEGACVVPECLDNGDCMAGEVCDDFLCVAE